MTTSAPKGSTALLLGLAGTMGVAAGAITQQSFWIDEAHTAWKAAQPTLQQWWSETLAERGSDMQMPFYMLFVWAWEKLFGSGEWWLRAANLPWLLLGFLSVALRRPAMLVAAVISPFVWYYAGEARPYAMQVAASLLIFASLDRLACRDGATHPQDGRIWDFGLAAGVVLLSGSSLVGMYWAGAALAAALVSFGWARTAQLIRGSWPLAAAAASALFVLAGYYVWTLESGAHAYSGSPTGLRNLVYIGYELLGFSGLGPGRLEIRTSGLAAFRAYVVPLAIYGGFLVALFWSAAQSMRETAFKRKLVAAAAILAAATVFLLVAGHLRSIRLLGRHFAPLLPIVLWCVAAGLKVLWRERRRPGRAVVIAFVVVSLMSCLPLRSAVRHRRDSYREAAAAARVALERGEVVWWNADFVGGRFYGVRLSESFPLRPAEAWQVSNRDGAALEYAAVPDLVIASKPDLYDTTGALAAYLKRHRYRAVVQLPAFLFWVPADIGSGTSRRVLDSR